MVQIRDQFFLYMDPAQEVKKMLGMLKGTDRPDYTVDCPKVVRMESPW